MRSGTRALSRAHGATSCRLVLLPGLPRIRGLRLRFRGRGKAELNLDSPLLEQQLLLERFNRYPP